MRNFTGKEREWEKEGTKGNRREKERGTEREKRKEAGQVLPAPSEEHQEREGARVGYLVS